ncbi:4-hydroxybutyrate coenzyme A transferase [hydrothermal vent metagenome]|uniref:4-hydroxybutyrate coenzyme A transferase n=1 Tax=hydrothermal vent metagenome TaxID=652676 RepID=A0A3B0VFX5_9ZZZZ
MEYDNNWQEKYSDMIATARGALARLRPGQRVFVGTGCAEPLALVSAMTDRAGQLADVEIIQLITKGDAPYADKRLADCFTINSFFIGSNVRNMIQEGLGNYTPILMSDVPRLLHSGRLPLDVALIQVTPPDSRGKVSLGISVDIVRSAAENASLVIAQVNPHMPWTHGDSLLDIYDLDLLVPVEAPLIERLSHPPHEVSKKIGREVAALIPDGATVEFGLGRVPGVGRIPQAVMDFLHDKKDLGIHTEMISDSLMDLLESGAVTGARKTIDRGRITTSFCMGTKKLYDYVDDNPLFCFRPTEYVNDSNVIGKQKRMVSINMALEIDLTGQVCSDSVAGRFYSGIGGQVDFNRGAARSDGGRAVITMPSTNKDGSRSRIVTTLEPGSGVVISRGTVHYVVTEYGTAFLHGKSIQERVMALISIAHPDFREQLFQEAVEARYLRPELAGLGNRFMVPGEESMRTSFLLDDGTQVSFRSILPTDEPHMRDLLYNLSQETIYYRFMSRQQRFTHRQILDFVYIDHRRDVAIVGTVPEAHGDEIIAVGRYYLNNRNNKAEVAFVVRDGWQNKGIGSFMFRHLIAIARRNGIAGFTAEVLRDNYRMQAIFNHSGYRVQSRLEGGVYSFVIDF